MVEFGCQRYKTDLALLQVSFDHNLKQLKEKDQMIDAWRADYKQLSYDKDLNISLLKIQLTKTLKLNQDTDNKTICGIISKI